jgi:hypothetical protein
MINNPHIPMSPGELPQQRIHEVINLPKRPDPFICFVGYGCKVPQKEHSEYEPRSPIYLGQTEWAWDPMHCRLESYYLQRDNDYWVLWAQYWSDNDGEWGWITIACLENENVSEEQAAVHLLIEFWKHEAEESSLDHYHWINEADYLSVAQLAAIGRAVWE